MLSPTVLADAVYLAEDQRGGEADERSPHVYDAEQRQAEAGLELLGHSHVPPAIRSRVLPAAGGVGPPGC